VSDLGVIKPELNIARLEVEIDSQRIVIEGKALRLLEVAEEEERVAKDDVRAKAEVKALDDRLKKMDDGIEAKRALYRKHEFEHITKKNRLRLLELAEEREAIAADVAASEAHIAQLEAEASQQNARLKER